MPQNYFSYLFVFFAFLFFTAELIYAQARFSGTASSFNAWETSSPNSPISARNQIRVNLGNSSSHFSSYFSGELRHTYLTGSDSLSFRFREGYISLLFENGDLTIGKQSINWGITDGDFILDLIGPFDLSEFITQDFSELREGVSSISYSHLFGRNELQIILNPVLESSKLPRENSRWSVISGDVFNLPTEIIPYRNVTPRLSDTQIAARLAMRPSLTFDLDLAALYWSNRNPSYFKQFNLLALPRLSIPESVTFIETYSPGFIFGGWGLIRFSNTFQIVFESAYFHNTAFDFLPDQITTDDIRILNEIFQREPTPDDFSTINDIAQRLSTAIEEKGETGFLKNIPSTKFMIGFGTPLFGWNTSFQYVGDLLLKNDDTILRDTYFHGISGSFSRSFLRDTLLFRLFGRYQFNGNDFWLNPEVRYNFADGVILSTGAHLFGGKTPPFDYAHLSFNSFSDNNLAFLRISWAW